MLEAEATADGSGLDVAALQISGARVVSSGNKRSVNYLGFNIYLAGRCDLPLCSSPEHDDRNRMQGPMELMKSWRLSPQRHVKSVVAHPTSCALLLRQLAAHGGKSETRSGSVEF